MMQCKPSSPKLFPVGLLLALITIATFHTEAFCQGETPQRIGAREMVTRGMQLNDGSEAEEKCYLDAFAMDASYPEPLFNLGLVYVDRRDYEVAITYFEQYLELKQDGVKATYMIGLCLDGLGRRGEAVETFNRYLGLTKGKEVDSEEQKYISVAKKALERLTGTSSPTGGQPPVQLPPESSYELRVAGTFADALSVEKIAEILKRPRTRSVPSLDELSTARFKSIQFRKDSADLLPESRGTLDKVAQAMLREDVVSYTIDIHGHTSTEGSDEHNLALSDARAVAVKKYMLSRGIGEDRLRTKGFGKKNPIYQEESNEEQRQQNRRVEFSGSLSAAGGAHGGTGPGDLPQ